MIVTVTPNPSIDRTVTLATPLTRGTVHRVTSVTTEAGGKGVNVARALTLAGVDSVALLPAPDTDPLIAALHTGGVPFRCVPTVDAVRTNLTITETDGTTTKLNEPGAALDAAAVDALTQTVVAMAESASWVVLSGSLPPGMPDSWYADIVATLAPFPCRVAVDTSEGPLRALVDSFDRAAPDLIKPNAEELAGVLGFSPQALEAAVAQGDPEPVVSAARRLIDRGSALCSPPSAPPAPCWSTTTAAGSPPRRPSCRAAPSAPATPPSPDMSGAEVGGADPPQRLRMPVAYGSAAAALPGSALPAPPTSTSTPCASSPSPR